MAPPHNGQSARLNKSVSGMSGRLKVTKSNQGKCQELHLVRVSINLCAEEFNPYSLTTYIMPRSAINYSSINSQP